MLAYLRRVIAQGTEESSRRFSLVAATLTINGAILMLAAGAVVGLANGVGTAGLAEALWPLSLASGALAGYAYTRGPAPAEAPGATTLPPNAENAASKQIGGVAS